MKTEPIISSPHQHDGSSVTGVMLRVGLALLPGVVLYIWFFGLGILVQCLLAVLFAVFFEVVCLRLVKKSTALFVSDGSAVVTALLFALCIPPYAPWWITMVGMLVAIGLAKHAFGGIGHNPFNPAMVGFLFVLLSFPIQMTTWPAVPGMSEMEPALGNRLQLIFFSATATVDGWSGPTPLAEMQSRLGAMNMVPEISRSPLFGHLGGKGWEWINIGYLIGGAVLMLIGVINWRIPVAVLTGVFLSAALFALIDADIYPSPLFHVFSGATILCAFFIATDPVSAATTPRGQLIYGCLIGVVTYLIRAFGAYPDGVAFAVLLANGLAPTIDRYTRPKVLGE